MLNMSDTESPPPSTSPSPSPLSHHKKRKRESGMLRRQEAKTLFSLMRRHHKLLSLKRSFVAGLCGQRLFNEKISAIGGNESMLPESFMRQDDVFYEDAYTLVERCLGIGNPHMEQSGIQIDQEFFDSHNTSRFILTFLDDLSNHGLYNLTKIVNRSPVMFVKTRPQMKKFIKDSLLEVQSNQFSGNNQVIFQKELLKLLQSPKNFRQNFWNHAKSWNFRRCPCLADVMMVLDGLEGMRGVVLSAIHRKLKGTEGYMLDYPPCKQKYRNKFWIPQIRILSSELIAQRSESGELPEPLSKAMAVACLYSEIASCSKNFSVSKYISVTPEVEALQNEILHAIRLLPPQLDNYELMKLQDKYDPDCKMKSQSLSAGIRNMLIQFLFECNDMDVIPEYLLDAVSFVNENIRIHGYLTKDLLEEDVECILNLSSHLRQIFWDCDSSNQLDGHFVNAYMEELDDSDDGDFFSDDDVLESQVRFNGFTEEVGSTDDALDAKPDLREVEWSAGGSDFTSFQSPLSVCKDEMKCTTEFLSPKLEEEDDYSNTKPIQDGVLASATNCVEQNLESGSQRNRYIDVQEVCDDASVIAYQLIGHMLDKFGHMEASGLNRSDVAYLRGGNSMPDDYEGPVENSTDEGVRGSVILEAVNRVIPSFPNSQLEQLMKLVRL